MPGIMGPDSPSEAPDPTITSDDYNQAHSTGLEPEVVKNVYPESTKITDNDLGAPHSRRC